jgi:hypothetical protein
MADEEQTDVQTDVVADDQPSSEAPIEEPISLDDEQDDGPRSVVDDEGVETGDDEGGETVDETGDEDTEILEFDFGGNKLKVPKESVAPELVEKIEEFTKGTWSTFTRDQQVNVERAKSLDARESTVAKLNSLNGDALQTYSYGLQLRSEIEQLSQVDLNSLWQSDADRARQISDMLGAKQAEFQTVVAKVGEQEQAVDYAQREDSGRRIAEGTAYLDKHIKNFSSQKAETLVDYVMGNYGMSREQADQWAFNPVVTRMAYKAMLYDRQTGAAKRSNSVPSQAKPVKAAPSSGATSGAQRDPNKMTMGQLAKHLGAVGT